VSAASLGSRSISHASISRCGRPSAPGHRERWGWCLHPRVAMLRGIKVPEW